ncbi:hypothetical protein [Palleronia pelagia]|uniref:Oxidoreductase molybdopterin-binding domain-containing protein n=1 Tax=Palleronia pelagia TaxID=387096 RepID=A0A1H8H9N6_9RHOB|nr:hypothetical protein [Palleronia pelagia]SEN52845.1 hypothetical protein SAMN04488011_104359 [Palleronia pelagia]
MVHPFRKLGLAGLLILFSTLSWAGESPKDDTSVILTVTGSLDHEDGEDIVQFDLERLRALDETRVETSTIWTNGTHVFHGTSLAAFVDALNISEGKLRARAINDYAVDIPVSDAVEGGPILAWHLDGAPMSLREKGPLWLIYPYDSDSQYRSDLIYSRSIWQLDRIEIIR